MWFLRLPPWGHPLSGTPTGLGEVSEVNPGQVWAASVGSLSVGGSGLREVGPEAPDGAGTGGPWLPGGGRVGLAEISALTSWGRPLLPTCHGGFAAGVLPAC